MDRSVFVEVTGGAIFMFCFGIVWLLIGLLQGRPSPAWLRRLLLVVGLALGASIATLGVRESNLRHSPSAKSAQQLATGAEIARHFYIIFGVELAAIFVAVVVLKALRYPDYILCGIAIIVGVHFFPLAALFRAPVYYGTGLFGCAIGLTGFLVADAGLRQKIVALSFGFLLWMTAAWITGLGFTAPLVVRNLPPM
jgi:hypothetical protein